MRVILCGNIRTRGRIINSEASVFGMISNSDNLDDEFKMKLEQYCDDIFGILFEIKIVLDIGSFRKWLKVYHKIEDDSGILLGYQFMIKTLIATLISAIDSNISLGLNEDFTYHRAMRFVGFKPSELPNTCEKAIFIKNIFELAKPLWRARSWRELEGKSVKFIENCISIFDKIFRNYVTLSDQVKLDKEDALKKLAIFYTLVNLTDVHKGMPNGYISSFFTYVDLEHTEHEDIKIRVSKKKSDFFKKIFYGYKYALQFLWHSLLDEKTFEKYVSRMHLAEDWCPPNEIFDSEGDRLSRYKKGKYLDDFFTILKGNVIDPMEEEMKIGFPFNNIFVMSSTSISKDEFGILLSRKPTDPEYNEEEMLESKLYWYPAELVVSTNTFNGVPAFIHLLSGMVVNRRMRGIEDSVKVSRFKHPISGVGNRYSYGILIETISNVGADYSGWIIFFDCATDYSGYGGFLHSLAEKFISSYAEKGMVELIEIEIEREKLLKHLKENIVRYDVKDIIRNWEYLQSIEMKFDEARGVLIELLLYYVLSEKVCEKLIWRYKKDDIEIDLVASAGKDIYFFECKCSCPPDIDDECRRFENKVNKLLEDGLILKKLGKEGEEVNVHKVFCFWRIPHRSKLDIIKRYGMEVYILPDLLRKCGRTIKMDKISFLLD